MRLLNQLWQNTNLLAGKMILDDRGVNAPWSSFTTTECMLNINPINGCYLWCTMKIKKIKYLTVCLLSLIASELAFADDYEKAVQAAKSGNRSEAINILKSMAEKGDIRAQAELGSMFLTSGHNDKDTREGVKWIKSAADRGNPVAQYNLGNI